MKEYGKWLFAFYFLLALGGVMTVYEAIAGEGIMFALLLLLDAGFLFLITAFWLQLRRKGIQSDAKISRILGRDAKEALSIGEVGIITYNEEYEATWVSDYLRPFFPNLVNHKLTVVIDGIKDLFQSDIDSVVCMYNGNTFEFIHKEDSSVLFARNISELERYKKMIAQNSIVVGTLTLDNYSEYLSYDNEALINDINTRIRTPLLAWAKEMHILMRRTRSDRYLLVLDSEILTSMRKKNFPILQKIKDAANKSDLSMTISAAFVSDQPSFLEIDRLLNELTELVQSRGGDQIAIKKGENPVEFIGGNSEKSTQRSKARVRTVGASLQDVIRSSQKVFILGHVNTDYDAMGAALAASNWVRALGKDPYIVLKDVPRDSQLSDTMNAYSSTILSRHRFITEEQALEMADDKKDLLVLVDHSNPAISSGKELLKRDIRKVIIDHHRRNAEASQENVLVSYIEPEASSTCELMTELLESSTVSIPIYEMEATIMYLGIVVDTSRFKQHTSERTFQAAATLRSWGANANRAEQALQVDYSAYRRKAQMIEKAKLYRDKYLIDILDEPVSRTMLSKISDELLSFKGCSAAFTIGINENNGSVAVSARSDGSVNVQKIMEKMNGGGHFTAAALERENATVEEVAAQLQDLLDEEEE